MYSQKKKDLRLFDISVKSAEESMMFLLLMWFWKRQRVVLKWLPRIGFSIMGLDGFVVNVAEKGLKMNDKISSVTISPNDRIRSEIKTEKKKIASDEILLLCLKIDHLAHHV
jgi:hypothetical protein